MKPSFMKSAEPTRKKVGLFCGAAALATAGLLMIPGVTSAQGNPVTASTSAGAVIYEPINLTNTTGLDFGRILPPTSGAQNFIVDAENDTITVTGTGDGQALGIHVVGVFDATGQPNAELTITENLMGCDRPTSQLNLTNITLIPPNLLPVQFDGSGDIEIKAGGTLLVGSTAAPGPVSCQYEVTLSYS